MNFILDIIEALIELTIIGVFSLLIGAVIGAYLGLLVYYMKLARRSDEREAEKNRLECKKLAIEIKRLTQ